MYIIKLILQFIIFPPILFSNKKLKKYLNNKTILITGASRGIGRSLAFFLSNFSCNLILIARSEEQLKEICSKIGTKSKYYACDLRDSESLEQVIQQIDSIDILISNAGKSFCKSAIETSEEDFMKIRDINFSAPVSLIRQLILSNKLRKNSQIINISSANIKFPSCPFWSAYQSSKIAFDQWFKSFSFEQKDIDCKTIYLPLVDTDSVKKGSFYSKQAKSSLERTNKIIGNQIVRKGDYQAWWLGFSSFVCRLFPNIWGEFVAKTFQDK